MNPNRLPRIAVIAGSIAILSLVTSPTAAQESADGLASPAPSSESRAPSRDIVDVEVFAGTTAPLDLYGGANLVFFDRLFLTASVGRTVYGGLAGSAVRGLAGDEVATIVEPLVSGAWVLRFGFGVRPFGQRGPEAVAGYARINGSARWDAGSLGVPARVGELSADVGLNAFFVEIGWSIDIFGPLYIRPAIGWTQVVGSNVSVSASGATGTQVQNALGLAEDEVSSVINRYGRTPTLSLGRGARF
ncbi:MAG: hypothetical protein AAGE52_09345 [Myxococcota bacterium]